MFVGHVKLLQVRNLFAFRFKYPVCSGMLSTICDEEKKKRFVVDQSATLVGREKMVLWEEVIDSRSSD